MRLYRYFTLLWSDVRAYWVQGSVKHAQLQILARLFKVYITLVMLVASLAMIYSRE